MSEPLVTIITPTWKRPGLLERTIECIDKQTFTDWEHIIVHDGPEGMLGSDDERRIEFCLPRNANDYGVTPINAALEKARGKYYTIFADDNEMAPKHLERLVELFEKDEGLAFAYAFAQYIDAGSGEQKTVLNSYVPAWQKIDLGQVMFRRSIDQRYGPWVYTRWSYDWDRLEMLLKAGHRFRVNADFTVRVWKAQEVRNNDVDEVWQACA